jgi:hypothetical protein
MLSFRSFPPARTVKESSVIVVQIFDQKKFKRKDQGFLGVINIKVSQVLDLDLGGEGSSILSLLFELTKRKERERSK